MLFNLLSELKHLLLCIRIGLLFIGNFELTRDLFMNFQEVFEGLLNPWRYFAFKLFQEKMIDLTLKFRFPVDRLRHRLEIRIFQFLQILNLLHVLHDLLQVFFKMIVCYR